jgi:hypothetical protein
MYSHKSSPTSVPKVIPRVVNYAHPPIYLSINLVIHPDYLEVYKEGQGAVNQGIVVGSHSEVGVPWFEARWESYFMERWKTRSNKVVTEVKLTPFRVRP